MHGLVEVATAPERRHPERVRVRRPQSFEDEVGFELPGIVAADPIFGQRLECLEMVAVREFHVQQVNIVALKRQVALVYLVERTCGRRVPHPGAAVADALIGEHLVVEPTAELALGIVERNPERLGLVGVIAHRMELVVVRGQRNDCWRVHASPQVSAGQPRSYIAPDDGLMSQSSRIRRFQ